MSKTTIDGFESSASRIIGEREERLANAALALDYHHGFLDDVLRGILPHDLILIGAPSGVGKTDLALQIAASNAKNEKRPSPVAYFALEAEPRELERRMKYAMISRWAHQSADGLSTADAKMNYTDWMMGRHEATGIGVDFSAQADGWFLTKLSGLHTFYRGIDFDHEDLRTKILEIAPVVRLIVIDHIHYIDITDENEARGLSDTMKMLRDLSINLGKPILLVAHLRKRNFGSKQLVATLDDFHGSSNIVKQATHAIVLDRAKGIEPPKWWLSPTFVTILKDRRGGETGHVALCQYDKRKRHYQKGYSLGRLTKGDTEWEEIEASPNAGTGAWPGWAKHHQYLGAS